MGVKEGYSFDRVYERYLSWFQEKAEKTVRPKGKEELLRYQVCSEDVFEDSSTLLNRVYFLVPLLPMESRSGRLEVFAISELNLMKKSKDDEVEVVMPVEYTAYP